MRQSEHEKWNSTHYPGTRQLCSTCDEPTGRCEEDSIFASEDEDCERPLCEACYALLAALEETK
jgi:hypothetical protein